MTGVGSRNAPWMSCILKHPEAIVAAAILYKDLAELHQRFFAHRSGKAVPITATAA